MRFRRFATALAVLVSVIAGAVPAGSSADVPPAIPLFPDDFPSNVPFFFPSGGPLERFTGKPGAWYALYRAAMYPGRPYDLLLWHPGDPDRLKIFALDGHPFGPVSVRQEIRLRRIDGRHSPGGLYTALVQIPRDSAEYGIYLLLEWFPPAGRIRPLQADLQILSADRAPPWGGLRPWWRSGADRGVESPLQQERRRIYEIPVPRAGAWEKERLP